MTIAEILKEITLQEEFFERLQCQTELLAGMSVDKPNNYILNCICQSDDLFKVLRLICIHSVANNGFKQPLLETYKRELIRVIKNLF